MTTLPHAAVALLVAAGSLFMTQEPPSALPEKQQAADKDAASPLAGRYTIVSGEKDGKPVPAEKLRGSVVVFTADRMVGTDRDKKEFFTGTYVLDTAHKPWLIKMTSTLPKEAEAVGLVKKEGDTVTIIYALPGADAPTEFRTRDRQHLFVLKAAGDAPRKDPMKVIKD